MGRSAIGLWTAALILACAAPALADTRSFLSPIGPIAELQRTEIIWATALILVAILPVLIGAPLILWRYRRANTAASYRPMWEFNTKLEILMWAGPALIVLLLSVWLAQATFRIAPHRGIDTDMAEGFEIDLAGPPLRVDVIGLDWKWLFLYPDDGVASVGELVLPVGRPVSMRLTSDTVMQSFMATGLAGQIYAMPSMTTRLNLIADRPGETLAENTQYNGPGFPSQRAPIRAVSFDAYEDWIETALDSPPLDDRTYSVLAQTGDLEKARADLGREGEGPLHFRLDGLGLFERVVFRYTAPNPVPPEAQPGSPAYDPAESLLPSLAGVFPGAFCGPGATRLAAVSLPER